MKLLLPFLAWIVAFWQVFFVKPRPSLFAWWLLAGKWAGRTLKLSHNVSKPKLLSNTAHLTWVRLMKTNGLTFIKKNKAYDIRGSEFSHVLHLLDDSSLLWLIHRCDCGETADGGLRGDLGLEFLHWSWGNLAGLSGKLSTVYTEKKGHKCKGCKKRFSYERGVISDATFFCLLT